MSRKIRMLVMTLFMVCALSLAVQVKAAKLKNNGVDYLSTNMVGISLPNDGYYKDVQLIKFNGKVIKTEQCLYYKTFNLSKNKVYYFRWRYNDSRPGYVKHTNWEKKVGIATCEFKPYKSSGLKIKVKAPKVKGAKLVYLMLSTKYRNEYNYKGWKKAAKVKPGKKVTVKKYNKKKLSTSKSYYFKAKVKGKYGNCICPNDGRYFYFYYRYR